jgi:hypothetical protein
LSTPADRIDITITDSRGRVPRQSELKTAGNKKIEMNVSELKPGIYFLHLQTKDERKTISFIKQ